MTDHPDLPPRSHPNWNALASGKIRKPWATLGVKILMTRVASEIAKDNTPANVQKCGDEIYDFFKKNTTTAAPDIRAVFG